MELPASNLRLEHWNPNATQPLVLPVHLVCNTSDEQIYQNIYANSRAKGNWLRLEDEHDGIAVLCGSGPSIAEYLDDIRIWRAKGAKIFALNGCAKFLADNGILADYQVMIDAREETAQLVGPAKEHLFGSQVHPETFAKAPKARLWHLQVEGMDDYLPEYEGDYCLIGGAAAVGNTATCLAYAMGYRILHCYGYDSSHKDGMGHAFRQSLNDGEPCASVRFRGKDYIASLTMKLQAERFMETSQALKEAGTHVEVHGYGLLPDMFNAPPLPEQTKYQMLWELPQYRAVAPGEDCAELFLKKILPRIGRHVIDFGAGTGRGALALAQCGLRVTMVDFAENCLDEEVKAHLAPGVLEFHVADLDRPIGLRGDYGYCTDVMEHIPTDRVEAVIRHIMACVPEAFFQISLVDDVMGSLIGDALHLTVKPHSWWRDLFTRLGLNIQWSEDQQSSACFHISTT